MSSSHPLRSMTGFARVRRPFGDGEVVASVKTVNHRGLDVHLHAPGAADPMENAIRSAVKAKLARGHVDVRILLPDTDRSEGGAVINEPALAAYVAAFRAAAARHGLSDAVDLNAALRIPGILGDSSAEDVDETLSTTVLEAVNGALDELNAFREREGREIANDMRGHNTRVAAVVDEIDQIRQGATAAFHARLSTRLTELLKGSPIDPQRLAQEVAMLADRSDVGEEIARLRIHSGQLAQLLDRGGETGKKLDFLLQEMNRESNTILSKTSGIGDVGLKITDLALAAKASIEKIREQALNLE